MIQAKPPTDDQPVAADVQAVEVYSFERNARTREFDLGSPVHPDVLGAVAQVQASVLAITGVGTHIKGTLLGVSGAGVPGKTAIFDLGV